MVKTSTTNLFIIQIMATVPEDFHKWLTDRLEERGWGIREAARQIGVSHPTISDIVTYRKQPSFDTVLAIAATFRESPVSMLYLSGLLPAEDPRGIAEDRASYKLKDLNRKQLKEVMWYIDMLIERDEIDPPKKSKAQYRTSREGETPPEVVKGKI